MLKFDISELDIGSTPNIDYIGTVESTGGTVEYKTYPIEAPREFVMLLYAMLYDDSKSVLHMQTAFARRYRASDALTIEKNFLAPQKLNDRYVTQATIPEQIAKEDYVAGMCEVEKQARVRYNSAVDAGSVLRYPMEVSVERQKLCHAKKLKKRFVTECLKFLPAYGYQRALEKWHIRDRLNREVRMYSTDTIGWTTYNYVINRDVCIQLDSNFGYGQSSYFLLSCTKGSKSILLANMSGILMRTCGL